ncbi:HD domain-containing protein [Lasiosphaeria ovina]|uniref:5'-deoxynucleotidase n=1 Tax=Lasiosphaeria ovina TaxID=92902 RepID=A0AAE0NDG7_9PEZI|nr:HD domain-containing protein [Lasiosphaeria ovina]
MSPSASEGNAKANNATDSILSIPDVADVPNPNSSITGPWTVDKALGANPAARPAEGSGSPLPYFHLLERLKTMKREGWRRFGIRNGESIADHMYRMSLMTMLAPPALAAKLDMAKCMRMCLIHDMAESVVGDITPVDGVSKPEKSRREATTMDYITGGLLGKVNGGSVGQDIRAVWQEYEDSETPESHFVHDIDKMELLLQMVEYEKRGEGKLDLGEFTYVGTKIVLDDIKIWAAELLKEREAFWDGHAHIKGDEGVAGGVAPDHKKMQDEYYSK